MEKEAQIISSIYILYNKIARLNRLKLEEYAKSDRIEAYTASEMMCLEYIGKHKEANVTRLAEVCFMTRSALSKIMKKMLRKGLIGRYQKPENQKEVYFVLTAQGRRLYELHEEMTRRFLERDRGVFEQTPERELDAVLKFLDRYGTHLDQEIRQIKER